MIIKIEQDEIQQYLSDQANLTGSCDKVFIVKNSQEIIDVVVKANELKIPLTVCGNHTSLTGASLPSSGWVISTEELNQVLEINEDEMYAIVEPGITLRSLQLALAPFGLFFPPDPTEDSCFIGGMIGTNASGARSFSFGPTRSFIEALEVVLPTGEEVSVSCHEKIVNNQFVLNSSKGSSIQFDIPWSYVLPDVKNAAGYFLKPEMSPVDVFIGAEGTLGIVTRARLKLKKVAESYISMVIFFEQLEDCFKCIDKLRITSKNTENLSNVPKACTDVIEFFDENSLNILRDKFPDIPGGAKAALWVECGTYSNSSYDLLLNEWEAFLLAQDIDPSLIWFGADSNDRAKIKDMRHALPISINEIIKKRNVKKLGTDIAVPNHLFEDFYYKAIRETEKAGLQYVVFGHFGDAHMHLNIIPSGIEQMKTGKKLYDDLCLAAIDIGGTFSAEHGVGKLKCNYLKVMIGDVNFQFMKDVKHAFDPENILGRGTLFNITN
jgi:D-lactate dehydrogenase (cytochrome)